MDEQTLRMKLHFYQRMMMVVKTAGDLVAHEIYLQITREIVEQLKEMEKTACSQQTA
ncbi:hypothetical protein NDK47_17940 [Brevibacillus ruminantium]|uniref:Uncharacterized protein n=1 Tax=Brevibacillus ruminantium TaxID=2950604 RepID=A0ABY4WA19_9BACL|nr:hypothetical protein [Brevibacillus ruminantium]USG64032.1 hypothetical protein NDK47_17940 [Brevibacillus ruminantium]